MHRTVTTLEPASEALVNLSIAFVRMLPDESLAHHSDPKLLQVERNLELLGGEGEFLVGGVHACIVLRVGRVQAESAGIVLA